MLEFSFLFGVFSTLYKITLFCEFECGDSIVIDQMKVIDDAAYILDYQHLF